MSGEGERSLRLNAQQPPQETAQTETVPGVELEGVPHEDTTKPESSEDADTERTIQNDLPASSQSSQPCRAPWNEPLPHLQRPHRRRKIILNIGVTVVTLDLCVLPITYYYALKFGTSLKLQDIFAVITAVYGMISFCHYGLRSLKLFRSKTSPLWMPVGWKSWGLLEFLHINVLVVIALVEIELVAGTAPNKPIVRLCAMPSPTICYYLGSVCIISCILTQMKTRLTFNMSSTPKGTPWRPALLAFVEDAGAIEGQGGISYRSNVMKRYEVSPRFRRMILAVTWAWGLGLIGIAIVATILIAVLDEDIGFGVGWGLPYAFAACWTVITSAYVKSELRKEAAEWRTKEMPLGATVSEP